MIFNFLTLSPISLKINLKIFGTFNLKKRTSADLISSGKNYYFSKLRNFKLYFFLNTLM